MQRSVQRVHSYVGRKLVWFEEDGMRADSDDGEVMPSEVTWEDQRKKVMDNRKQSELDWWCSEWTTILTTDGQTTDEVRNILMNTSNIWCFTNTCWVSIFHTAGFHHPLWATVTFAIPMTTTEYLLNIWAAESHFTHSYKLGKVSLRLVLGAISPINVSYRLYFFSSH